MHERCQWPRHDPLPAAPARSNGSPASTAHRGSHEGAAPPVDSDAMRQLLTGLAVRRVPCR